MTLYNFEYFSPRTRASQQCKVVKFNIVQNGYYATFISPLPRNTIFMFKMTIIVRTVDKSQLAFVKERNLLKHDKDNYTFSSDSSGNCFVATILKNPLITRSYVHIQVINKYSSPWLLIVIIITGCICGVLVLIIFIVTRSELASLAPSFRGHNFVQNTRAIIYNDCAHVRACAYSFVLKPHPQSILRGVVCDTNVAATCILLRSIIDIIDFWVRKSIISMVQSARLAKETRYSRGSFARNNSRQKTPTTESPPSVKQSRTTSNPERCSFVAFESPKVSLPVDLHFLPGARF